MYIVYEHEDLNVYIVYEPAVCAGDQYIPNLLWAKDFSFIIGRTLTTTKRTAVIL